MHLKLSFLQFIDINQLANYQQSFKPKLNLNLNSMEIKKEQISNYT